MTSPNPSEMEILHSLWTRELATVREIHDDIVAKRRVGYTTILKQVQRMEEKSLLERVSKSGRAHQYKALVQPAKARRNLISKLVDSAFGGSTSQLVLHALGNAKPGPDEIKEIRKLLDELEE